MNAWFVRPCSQRILSDVSSRRALKAVVMLAPLFLSACNSYVNGSILSSDTATPTPKAQVADYRIAQCEHLWQVDDSDAMNNALYWLRAMDCAGRLTPFQAREGASHLEGEGWENAFKRGILLDNAAITQTERRQMLDQLNLYRLAFPAALRPLVQIWRERQIQLLALSDERLRYKQLQESSDKQLDVLRSRHTHLQYQLETMARKLENLTDIERQLSSRKQLSGELPENEADPRDNHAVRRSTSESIKADDTYAPPVESETGKSTTNQEQGNQ